MVTIGPSVPVEVALEVLRSLPPALLDMSWRSTLLGLCLVWYLARHHHPVYLVDFVTFEPPDSWRLTHEQLMTCMRRQRCFTEESISFLKRILDKSGTGQRTAWPPGITQCLNSESATADQSVEAARKESETVICEVVRNCLHRTETYPTEVDILIVNCSLFSPTPSLCAMVMNRFKMRGDVMAYNLSGMGCSASLVGIELAQNVLRSHPNKVALVVSTENLTQNLYHGNERSMLLQNTLFRCGGAAMLLSNKWRDGQRSKFKLLRVVRTQGTGDEAYDAVYECQDANGEHGVRLDRNIVLMYCLSLSRFVLCTHSPRRSYASICARPLTSTKRRERHISTSLSHTGSPPRYPLMFPTLSVASITGAFMLVDELLWMVSQTTSGFNRSMQNPASMLYITMAIRPLPPYGMRWTTYVKSNSLKKATASSKWRSVAASNAIVLYGYVYILKIARLPEPWRRFGTGFVLF